MNQASQIKSRPKRPWPVTALGLLLIVQSLALGSLGLFFLSPLGPQWILTSEIIRANLLTISKGIGFLGLALLTLLTAFSFLRLRRGAWVNAVLLQGISLLIALGFYFYERQTFAYVMMLYGIGMVLYLNHAEVQAAFRAPPPSAARSISDDYRRTS
jgi:hypothetical protein